MQFGDVFRYNELDYVFLVGVNEVIYAAKVLEIDLTKKLEMGTQAVCKDGKRAHLLSQSKIYCYVKLTTDEVKGRIAHIGLTEGKDDQAFDVDSIGCSLNSADLSAIKKEILDGPVDKNLKDGVRDIEITDEKELTVAK